MGKCTFLTFYCSSCLIAIFPQAAFVVQAALVVFCGVQKISQRTKGSNFWQKDIANTNQRLTDLTCSFGGQCDLWLVSCRSLKHHLNHFYVQCKMKQLHTSKQKICKVQKQRCHIMDGSCFPTKHPNQMAKHSFLKVFCFHGLWIYESSPLNFGIWSLGRPIFRLIFNGGRFHTSQFFLAHFSMSPFFFFLSERSPFLCHIFPVMISFLMSCVSHRKGSFLQTFFAGQKH